MKRRIKAILTAVLVVSGCTAPQSSSSLTSSSSDADYAAFEEEHTFIDSLEEEALIQPSRTIASLEDFIYVLDYMAFYRIGEEIWFDIDPAYGETFYNPYQEFQKAYKQSDLADVYACQLNDGYYTQLNVVGIKYSMSKDIASAVPENNPDTPVVPSFDYELKGRGDYMPLIEASNALQIPCENGEQLYYLAMNGYVPYPVEGSVAEELYNAAREVLAARINEDMSDFEKIKAVYDYLTTEVRYDYDTAYSSDTYLVKEQAYYLEGVFFNHLAVCDGKAKACALLLNMIGIPCYRQTGKSETGDHAWNMAEIDDMWYVMCTTYGQSDLSESLDRLVPNYSVFLSGKDTAYGEEGWGYVPEKHLDIVELLEEEPYPYFEEMGKRDEVSLCVESMEETAALLDSIAHTGEYKAEILYTGEDVSTFEQELTAYLADKENMNAMPIKNERGQAYVIICLNK